MRGKHLLFCLTAWATFAGTQASESAPELLAEAVKAETEANYSGARKIYLQAVESFPDSADVWSAWGEHLRFYAHDYDAAKAAFERALKVEDASAHARAYALRGLGEIAMKRDDTPGAIEFFEKSLQAEPLADTHRSLCHLYGKVLKFERAAFHARAAVALESDDPISLLLLASQLERNGDHAGGANQFERALAISGLRRDGTSDHPVHCCVLYNAAGYLAVLGDQEAALNMLHAFFETPNHRHLTREEIESDPDFAPMSKNIGFLALLDEYLK